MKLTKIAIDKASFRGARESERDVRWDALIPGFGLRIYPSGKKSFVLSYRAHGRKRLMTLGRYGVLTLDQARDMARKRLTQVIEGGDPLVERKRETQGSTVRDLCVAFIDRHAKPHKKSWRTDQRQFDKFVLPAWANRKITSITRDDVAQFHSRMGVQSGYEANRTLATLSKMFEMAKRWGMTPATSTNPARGHDKFREVKRDRWVTPEEMPALAAAVRAEDNLYHRAAIWLYLLTGVRKTELLTAKWDDVDLKRAELRLPDTKAGRAHVVPLSPPAIEILRSLPRLEGNPYVLPGTKTGHHLVNVSKAWIRIRRKAGIEDVRLHDLRRTVGSWLAQKGSSLQLIGKVLNHSNLSTTQIYARLADEQPRKALELHGELMMKVAAERTEAETQ